MRLKIPFLVVVLLTFATPAFGQGATAALYGNWRIDWNASAAATRAAGMETEIESNGMSATIEFTSDARLRVESRTAAEDAAESDTEQGTWKVLDEMPRKLKLELRIEEQNDRSIAVSIDVLDKNTVQMTVDKEIIYVLRRVTGKK